jgi:hypothetical protein
MAATFVARRGESLDVVEARADIDAPSIVPIDAHCYRATPTRFELRFVATTSTTLEQVRVPIDGNGVLGTPVRARLDGH